MPIGDVMLGVTQPDKCDAPKEMKGFLANRNDHIKKRRFGDVMLGVTQLGKCDS